MTREKKDSKLIIIVNPTGSGLTGSIFGENNGMYILRSVSCINCEEYKYQKKQEYKIKSKQVSPQKYVQ